MNDFTVTYIIIGIAVFHLFAGMAYVAYQLSKPPRKKTEASE